MPIKDPNEFLNRMRKIARNAREGIEVRRNERDLRWGFELLDAYLTENDNAELPDDWKQG